MSEQWLHPIGRAYSDEYLCTVGADHNDIGEKVSKRASSGTNSRSTFNLFIDKPHSLFYILLL